MASSLSLSISQQVFTLFYAIAWGTMANALPRWKAFAWGAAFKDKWCARRALLSFAMLNVLPIVFFAFVLLYLLSGPEWELSSEPGTAFWQLVLSVSPALAMFGFYRIWMSLVAFFSKTFYGWQAGDERPDSTYTQRYIPEYEKELSQSFALGNLVFGVGYVVVFGILVPLLGSSLCHFS